MNQMRAVSLFASSGIGDLALQALDVNVIVANEIVAERSLLFQANFPDATMINGDVWEEQEEIVNAAKLRLGEDELDVLLATPPCQGMSPNGIGKLLAEVRAGNRPSLDPRNRLIIPTVAIIKALRPRLVVLENVPAMKNTMIENPSGELVNILDYVFDELGADYQGSADVVEFADYGVPQRRQRLITILSRDPSALSLLLERGRLIAEPTRSARATDIDKGWVTVRDAIGQFPVLDGVVGKNAALEFHPLHRVPILDEKKYEWIRHTPEGKGAFDNQCVNAGCQYQDNAVHGASRGSSGINQANTSTPLYCQKCGEILPRPYTEVRGVKRLMRGFTSAYKRMHWDLPSPTLTTNFSYPSSDHNVHPNQNRVLSIWEALCLHTVSRYDYRWTYPNGNPVSDSLIRDSIGESIPPFGLEQVLRDVVNSLSAQKPSELSIVA